MSTQTEINHVSLSTYNENDTSALRDDKRRLDTPDIEPDKYLRVESLSSYEQDKARKKPGRKPSTAEPANKRLAQNRAAQRAFRERKDNYVKELEAKVQELENARRLAEEENKLLQKKLSTFQGGSETGINDDLSSKETAKKETDILEERTLGETSSDNSKVNEVASLDNSIESWSPSENNNLPIHQSNDNSFSAIPGSANINQNSSYQLYTDDNSISTPSAFTYNDYMIPYGSTLAQEPLIDYNSGMGLTNPGLLGFDPYNSALGFNPSLFDYNSLLNTSFPQTFSNFDPVLYADYIQAYDPYNMVVLPTPNQLQQEFDPTTGLPLSSTATTAPSNDSDAAPKPECSRKIDGIEENVLNKAKKAAEEFDLDSLCTMLKDKATCSEIKQFFKTHCKDATT